MSKEVDVARLQVYVTRKFCIFIHGPFICGLNRNRVNRVLEPRSKRLHLIVKV